MPSVQGLSSEQARKRLTTDGPNVLPVARPPSLWLRLGAQMTHFLALMLWTAGGLAFVAGLPELGVAILLVVVINGVFAFIQESRAERAAARLRDLLPRRVVVLRDGSAREIDAEDLVVDDVVLLEAGDRISADLRAETTAGLAVDTSTLTGESEPSSPEPGDELFAGTFVVEGEAQAQVIATGSHTKLAEIAQLTKAGRRPRGPLANELDRVVRITAVIAVGMGAGFFAIAVIIGTPATDGFLFAIGVTVALVPEGLLPTVTLSLAIGAQRMSRQSALVRRLEAVETLGSTTFICTDKTGTLTRNEMSVVEVWTPAGTVRIRGEGYEPRADVEGQPEGLRAATHVASAAQRCSTGIAIEQDGRWIAQGDPMEAALDVLARRLDARTAACTLAPERTASSRIASALQARGHVVAMTGDGVNDGPALQFPLALTVLQVLSLDIGTDLLPALALGAEPPGPHAAEGPRPGAIFWFAACSSASSVSGASDPSRDDRRARRDSRRPERRRAGQGAAGSPPEPYGRSSSAPTRRQVRAEGPEGEGRDPIPDARADW